MNKNAMLTIDIGNLDTEIAARVAQRYVLKEIFLVDAKNQPGPVDRVSRDSFPGA